MQIVAEEVWKRLDLTAEVGLNKSDYLEEMREMWRLYVMEILSIWEFSI
jgi:hypothetical protein